MHEDINLTIKTFLVWWNKSFNSINSNFLVIIKKKKHKERKVLNETRDSFIDVILRRWSSDVDA